jgi:hypothetical protein
VLRTRSSGSCCASSRGGEWGRAAPPRGLLDAVASIARSVRLLGGESAPPERVGHHVSDLSIELTDAAWPDIVVGAVVAALFLRSALGVLREAWPAFGPPLAPALSGNETLRS